MGKRNKDDITKVVDVIFILAVVLVMLIFFGNNVEAQERRGLLGVGDLYLYTGAVSFHTKSSFQDANNNHQLVAIQYKNAMFGKMRNTFFNDTVFANYVGSVSTGDLVLSGGIGLSYGYRDCFSDPRDDPDQDEEICPDVGAMVSFAKYVVQPTLFYKPGVFGFTVRTAF